MVLLSAVYFQHKSSLTRTLTVMEGLLLCRVQGYWDAVESDCFSSSVFCGFNRNARLLLIQAVDNLLYKISLMLFPLIKSFHRNICGKIIRYF